MRVASETEMRVALVATMVLVFTLLSGQKAWACDCVTLSPSESFKNADVVFEGHLLRVQREPGNEIFFTYVFSVDKTVEGPILKTVTIEGSYSDCDANFVADVQYRVYARIYNGKLGTGSCAGNEVVAVLRRNVSYSSGSAAPVWPRRLANIAAVCGLGVLLGSGVFVWRRYLRK